MHHHHGKVLELLFGHATAPGIGRLRYRFSAPRKMLIPGVQAAIGMLREVSEVLQSKALR
jgi:hypothetical protein